MCKGEWRYMMVRINRLDQLIGSNWIRKADWERSTVGRGLPSEGCSQWAGRGLWRKMYGLSLHDYLWDLSYYFLWSLFDLLITLQKCIRFVGKLPHIIDIEKGIFRLHLSFTNAKYFHTWNIICFCKSLIVSTLTVCLQLGVPGWQQNASVFALVWTRGGWK